MSKYSNCYDHYFREYGLEFFHEVLPWEWFKAQAIAESALDPMAMSPAGAFGVMQLMPKTEMEIAKKLGVFPSTAPHKNIRLGIAYDRRCWDIFKAEHGIERVRFMLGAYNAGAGHIIKAQKIAGKNSLPTDKWHSITVALPRVTGPYATETINYVQKVETVFAYLDAQEKKA